MNSTPSPFRSAVGRERCGRLGNQFGAGQLFAGGAALDQHRLPAADPRPARNPRLFHRDFHYTKLDPGRARWFRWL